MAKNPRDWAPNYYKDVVLNALTLEAFISLDFTEAEVRLVSGFDTGSTATVPIQADSEGAYVEYLSEKHYLNTFAKCRRV